MHWFARTLFILGWVLVAAAFLGVVSRLVRPAGIEFVFLITSFWQPFLFGLALVGLSLMLRHWGVAD